MCRAKLAVPPVLLALLLLATPIGCCGAETPEGPLLIHGVQPNGGCEWITLFNHGRTEISLSDYSLSDGEGTVTFGTKVTVPAKTQITVFSSKPPEWAPTGPSVVDGKGARFSNFRLADAGDQAMLLRGGSVVDSFVYGNAETCEGWVGEPFGKIPGNGYAHRHSPFDTDSAADWRIVVPGRGEFDLGGTYDADVAPFSLPESGGEPIAQAISWAEEEILVSTYVFTHPGMASLLDDALYRGVAVSILVEGSPAGGMPEKSLSVLKTLEDSGAEVLVMDRDDGFRRFQYLHCKYAVIDGRYVVMSSENWTESSFSRNRGWGLIVDSAGYAGLMREVHLSDSSLGNPDVSRFGTVYPKAEPIALVPWQPFAIELDWHVASIEPVLSPNNSYEAMEAFIASAETRAYSQQLSFSQWWMESSESPARWMSQASGSDADVRLIVDDSFDGGDRFKLRDSAEAMARIGIETRFAPRFGDGGITHNKGIVVDDSVWIGSINWTWNSLHNNREAAVIVRSPSVSDYFADLFEKDWARAVGPEGLVRVEYSGKLEAGSGFSLRLAGAGDSECLWDIGGEVYVGNPIILRLGAGEHECSVITGDSERIDFALSVKESGDSFAFDPIWVFLPIAGAALTALLFKRKGRIAG